MIINGNALHLPLADESVQCVVTSPPYYMLRSYGIGAENGEIGLEQTPEEYVANMVAVFREVKRVLRPDGVVWLNIGDSYASGKGTCYNPGGGDNSLGQKRKAAGAHPLDRGNKSTLAVSGLKPKDLVGIPWRVAFALQQPYYTGVIRDERERYWLAALIDGEGCIGIRRQRGSGNRNPEYADSYIPYLTIKMSDRAPLDKAVAITGYGSVREEAFRVGDDRRKVTTVRTPYVWRLDGNKAVQIARELYPYLLVKQPQAAMVHTLDLSNKKKRRGKGNSVPDSEIRYRDEIYAAIKAFNQRATDQLPEWCQQPPSMTEPGWWLRSDIIFAKRNPMPESVKDRPTRSHEYVFLLTKSARYYYNADAIAEPSAQIGKTHIRFGGNKYGDSPAHPTKSGNEYTDNGTRNKRDVWSINTRGYRGAHFAVMPEALVEPCILAGSKPGDVVLDPFAGAGTVGLVASRLGRRHIGVELSLEYCAMAKQRIYGDAPLWARVTL